MKFLSEALEIEETLHLRCGLHLGVVCAQAVGKFSVVQMLGKNPCLQLILC